MRQALVVWGILGLVSTSFGVITYDPVNDVLDYGACTDLAAVVDPQLNAADVLPAQQCGIPLPTYNAMPPQVVHFNVLPQGQGNPGPVAAIVAHYDCADANKTVTIDNFHHVTLGFGGNGNYGLIPTSLDASNDSVAGAHDDVFNGGPSDGHRPWPTASSIGVNHGLLWFGCDISCVGGVVDSFAFTACGQPSGNAPTMAGNAYFLLDDGSYGTVPYVQFGGSSPQHVSVAYQAPVGRYIVGLDVIAESGSGGGSCQYDDLDDFGFTVIPEPATMGLLALSGLCLGAIRRRRR